MPKRKKLNQVNKKKSLRLPLFFIFSGIILLLIPSVFYLNQTIQLKFFTPKIQTILITPKHQTINYPIPIEISIPVIKMNLQIGETYIDNNIWGIFNEGVSHLNTSARPGEKGTIILYAHNTQNRFGSIPYLKKDQLIILKTEDNIDHEYIITQTIEVKPNRVDLFMQNDETLILYTCSGFADLKRFVVLAKPTKKI